MLFSPKPNLHKRKKKMIINYQSPKSTPKWHVLSFRSFVLNHVISFRRAPNVIFIPHDQVARQNAPSSLLLCSSFILLSFWPRYFYLVDLSHRNANKHELFKTLAQREKVSLSLLLQIPNLYHSPLISLSIYFFWV